MINFFAKKFRFAVIFLLFALPFKIGATTLLEVQFGDVVDNSEFIFEGQVVAQKTMPSKRDGSPYTYFTFQVFDVLKGLKPDSDLITLGFSGGTIDGKTVFVHGLHMPRLHEKGIYFVESLEKEFFNPLYGWHQGHYLVVEDYSMGVERVIPVLEKSYAPYVARTMGDVTAPTIRNFKEVIRTSLEGEQ